MCVGVRLGLRIGWTGMVSVGDVHTYLAAGLEGFGEGVSCAG